MYTLSDFDFTLPESLIAQVALPERSASRLLQVQTMPSAGDDTAPPQLTDRQFTELPGCLRRGDLLVFNDTRVLKARFPGVKRTGGKIEVLIERITAPTRALAQIRASKTPAPGSTLRLADAFDVVVGEREDQFYQLSFPDDCLTLIEQFGRLPLPPYITHAPDAFDETRYQTVFAAHPGAVAAPTAGLHFDAALLAQLDAAGIQRATLTLHVGAGTFQPVRSENLAEHHMHSEWFEIPEALALAVQRTAAAGGAIVAVGTTVMRALESAARRDAGVMSDAAAAKPAAVPAVEGGDSNVAALQRNARLHLRAQHGETDIFITPGYRFQIVDRLITNFHLPKSTLLMLVSAFAGYETIRATYRHAIAQRYRFFSYGDAMLLTRQQD
ncbi:MAG: S-adenosylmethionine:tRNA ribosyltransferase-isomerase [Janthinobacterium lividum]